jgi:glycosyltransferase
MKISIITVVFNNKKTIKDAIESVLSQTYKNIEYIIIDGASTDGTVEIIKSYKNKIAKFISEPDKGLYDAMNKGLHLATGDVIGILNSDDIYIDSKVVSKVVNLFQHSGAEIVYGDLQYVDRANTDIVIRTWNSGKYTSGLFKEGWHPPHPTCFVKKSIYDKYGDFDLRYKIAADYEIMLRFIEKYKIQPEYLPEVMVKMRNGGASNNSLKNIYLANKEVYHAWRNNGLNTGIDIILKKLWTKVRQIRIKGFIKWEKSH